MFNGCCFLLLILLLQLQVMLLLEEGFKCAAGDRTWCCISISSSGGSILMIFLLLLWLMQHYGWSWLQLFVIVFDGFNSLLLLLLLGLLMGRLEELGQCWGWLCLCEEKRERRIGRRRSSYNRCLLQWLRGLLLRFLLQNLSSLLSYDLLLQWRRLHDWLRLMLMFEHWRHDLLAVLTHCSCLGSCSRRRIRCIWSCLRSHLLLRKSHLVLSWS